MMYVEPLSPMDLVRRSVAQARSWRREARRTGSSETRELSEHAMRLARSLRRSAISLRCYLPLS